MIKPWIDEYRADISWERSRCSSHFDLWYPEFCLFLFAISMIEILGSIMAAVLFPALQRHPVGQLLGPMIIAAGLIGAATLYGGVTGVANRRLYRRYS